MEDKMQNLQVVSSLRSRIGAGLLLLLLVIAAHGVQAQSTAPDGSTASPTLRERIREKLLQRQADKAQKSQASQKADAPADQAITAPGTYRFTLEHDGLTRAYLVHVPVGYTPSEPTPVVFAFHGGGGNMELQADTNYNIVGKADSAGFIAVFPNGYSSFPSGKLATWNAGSCCANARDKKVDDVGFVRAIVQRLPTLVNVDRTRIFATGMSNGGMLSHRLACEMADTFRAIAPVAGTDGTLTCTPARPISVLQIHAKNDTHVLFNGGAGEDAFRDKSKVAEFVSVPETMARWSQRNRCAAPPKRVLEVSGAYCEAYSQCADGVQVQLCVTESGGHSWPGVDKVRSGKEAASHAISANDVMWDFFTRVSK
jgi:polyhydroxybutyrate depolymerase